MQGSGQVSAAEAAALGLNVRDTTPTPVGAPTVVPVGDVDTSNRLRDAINLRDPTSSAPRAKPSGVEGCEIWVKIGGTPPADSSECHSWPQIRKRRIPPITTARRAGKWHTTCFGA